MRKVRARGDARLRSWLVGRGRRKGSVGGDGLGGFVLG